MVFIKVSSLRNVVRFGSVWELAPRFVGPFPITERIDQMAYRVKLPERLSDIHNVFHISHLRKYLYDTASRIEPDQLGNLRWSR